MVLSCGTVWIELGGQRPVERGAGAARSERQQRPQQRQSVFIQAKAKAQAKASKQASKSKQAKASKQASAHPRELALVVDRAQIVEQLERAHERLRRGRVHEVKVDLF